MTKKELLETIEELQERLDDKMERIRDLENEQEECLREKNSLSGAKNMADRRIAILKMRLAYASGQLEVLKRSSGWYSEEQPTREEFDARQKEILIDDPEILDIINQW